MAHKISLQPEFSSHPRVILTGAAGLLRYRQTPAQLDAGNFEPAGFVLDLIRVLTVVFRLAKLVDAGCVALVDLSGEARTLNPLNVLNRLNFFKNPREETLWAG